MATYIRISLQETIKMENLEMNKPFYIKKKNSLKIENLFNKIKENGISALAQMSEENKVMITKWARDISDRYATVLEKHPTKLKNIVDLPASKEKIKIAIKISLTACFVKKLDEMVNLLKGRFVSIGTFQDINMDDEKKVVEEDSHDEKETESVYSSVFPRYHKYMEVIISEQNALLEDINNFINDLKELKKES
jgi:hypothetical protein